jgi:hypothetical protein
LVNDDQLAFTLSRGELIAFRVMQKSPERRA